MQETKITENDAVWLTENADALLADWQWPVDLVQLTSHFRKHHSASRAFLLCELLELRHRGRKKFAAAERMYFYRRGFEQATDETIGNYKAERFRGSEHTADLCCGIGGDAIALASMVNRLTLVDQSIAAVRFAEKNIQRQSAIPVTCAVRDVSEIALGAYCNWHIDPDRRVQGHRRSAPELCEPPLQKILGMSLANPHGCIKLSPAANAESLLERGAELEWIGHRREVQQQVAWLGSLAKYPGRKAATFIDSQGRSHTFVSTHPRGPSERPAESPRRFLFEPRPSLLASGLDEELATEFGFVRLCPQAAYYTAHDHRRTALFADFEVLDDLAYHHKALLHLLRSRGAVVEEIKKRGIAIDPGRIKKSLQSLSGSEPVVLFFYPQLASIRVAVTRRIPEDCEG